MRAAPARFPVVSRYGWRPAHAFLLGLAVALTIVEVVLRMVLGNLGLPRFRTDLADGRCVGLQPSSVVEYTGWNRRVSRVQHDVNELGYRGPERDRRRPPDALRILTVGDSFTYGQGVEADETIAAYLESGSTVRTGYPVEVLNFGVPGANLEDSVSQYEFFASDWQHDLVVWMLGGNDLDDSVCSLAERRHLWWMMANSYTFRVASLVLGPSHVVPTSDDSMTERADRLREGMRRFQLRAEDSRAHLVVVALEGMPLGDVGRRVLDEETVGRGFQVHDLESCTRVNELRGVPRLAGDGHYSAEGNRIAAACIEDWLLEPRGL